MNYTEDPSSLVPAVLLAANLGYRYLTTDEALSISVVLSPFTSGKEAQMISSYLQGISSHLDVSPSQFSYLFSTVQ